MSAVAFSPEEIRAQIRRIQSSAGLATAPSLQQLLEYTVEKALNGSAAEIKESTVAIDVFGRKSSSFNPKTDAIVRVQARKLRDRIAAWYEAEGAQDEVVIEYVRGSYVPRFSRRDSSSRMERSIAVLAFTNLSDTTALDYLCDGLPEEIRYLLGRIHGLRVVAGASSAAFRASTEDVPTIGRKLNADLLIRGAVRESGSVLRITAELVATEDGFLVWSDRWERPATDLFRLQDEIAAAIAGVLRSRASSPPKSSGSTRDLQAYQLFLKGRFYWNQRTEHGFRRAIEHYRAALERDPDFARAYAALADTYILVAAHHLEPAARCFEQAHTCCQRAIGLDPKLPAAYNGIAATLLMRDRKPAEAEQAWRTALELDPTYAYAWHGFGVFGCVMRPSSSEALAAMQEAYRLEPLSPAIACDLGVPLYYAGEYDRAIDYCLSAIDMHPSFSRTYVFLARCQAALGRFEAAVETCVRSRPLFTGRAFLGQLLATLGFTYGRMGRLEEAYGVIRELQDMRGQHFVSRCDEALIYTGMGDASAALSCLERANDDQEFWAVRIPTEPLLASLRTEARFRELTRLIFPFSTGC
ncbi:MAG TPA: tetratricopeptide repeat protein [Bryobacteraceae bacterium]|nr:tetratricopeptide repeat protein [Bryobacteraceae bacterium]